MLVAGPILIKFSYYLFFEALIFFDAAILVTVQLCDCFFFSILQI